MSPRAVFFDVDGVLIHGYHARAELRHCWDENLTRDFGIDRERFKNEFIFGVFVKEVIVGQRDLHDALSEYLPMLGYDGDPQGFIDYWLAHDSKLNLDLLEMIRRLKQTGAVSLYIATNQEHNRARHLMENLRLKDDFEQIFYAADLGVLKPERSYFEKIENALNLAALPDKPIFFDDTPKVVEAARACGWEAYEFIDVKNLHDCAFIAQLLDAEAS